MGTTYQVTLPEYAVKFLVKRCFEDIFQYDRLERGLVRDKRDDVEMKATQEVIKTVSEQLTASGIDGEKFVQTIRDETLNELEEIHTPF